jgi:MFS family permease
MRTYLQRLTARIPFLAPDRTTPAMPPDLRRHARHLYGDIMWYGLLAGSTIAFLNVYAARLGATALQIGLLTAGPAAVNLMFTLPAGRWLQHRPVGTAVFHTAVASRGLFLLYAFLPLLLAPFVQIQVLIWATLLLTIPAVALAIGFNALFAAAVPLEWRGHVVGRRNALISLIYVVTALASGYILSNTPLAVGYTVVFGIGAVGAIMSTYHLSCLRDVRETPAEDPPRLRQTIGDRAQLGGVKAGQGVGERVNVALRAFTRSGNLLRVEVLRGGFGVVILALFTFHAAQFMPVSLFPLRWVDELHFTDQQIAIGNSVFHTCVLLGSLQFDRLARRFGNHKLTVGGTALLSTYPLMTAFMPNLLWFIITSAIGGLAWAMVGGALGNYLLEKVPAGDRPAYLAWYNLALNAAILLGALFGPLMAEIFNLQVALVLAFVFRLAGSLFIWFAEPRGERREEMKA